MANIDLNDLGDTTSGSQEGSIKERKEAALRGLEANVLSLLQDLPGKGGKKCGHEWVSGDLDGSPGESCAISLVPGKIGVGADFATGQVVKDLFDVIGARMGWEPRGQGFIRILEWAEGWLGIRHQSPNGGTSHRYQGPVTGNGHQRVGITRGVVPKAHLPGGEIKRLQVGDPNPRGSGTITDEYEYHLADGSLFWLVYRIEDPTVVRDDGKTSKEVKPFNPWSGISQAPKVETYGQLVPYQLDLLVVAKAAGMLKGILFCEGEGKAQIATRALQGSGWIATSIMGGSKRCTAKDIADYDLGIFEGVPVVGWSDNDPGGVDFMNAWMAALSEKAASVKLIRIPDGVKATWDAADAVKEGRDLLAMIEGAYEPPPALLALQLPGLHKGALPPRKIDIDYWLVGNRYTGDAPITQWLIENIMPMAVAGVLAALGGSGKGFMVLDLALKVALAVAGRGNLDLDPPVAFGNRIMSHGRVIIVGAQDSRDEIHRRLQLIDPSRSYEKLPLHIIPLPNAGGPMTIVTDNSMGGCKLTDEWISFKADLIVLRPALIVLDPLTSFVQGNLSADANVADYIGTELASLAEDTGACVLIIHHMNKPGKEIDHRKSEEAQTSAARFAIRGSTALLDALRFGYAIWSTEDVEGKKICRSLGIKWKRKKVMVGALVKDNFDGDQRIRTYLRQDNGVLSDKTQLISDLARGAYEEDRAIVKNAVILAAEAGHPYTKTGINKGIFARSNELPPELWVTGANGKRRLKYGRNLLQDIVQDLLDHDELTYGQTVGVNGKPLATEWLCGPDQDLGDPSYKLKGGSYRPEWMPTKTRGRRD